MSLGQFCVVVGVRFRELWEQDQNTVHIAPPRWSLNPWKLLHQPAEPEPLPEVQLGCNLLQGGAIGGLQNYFSGLLPQFDPWEAIVRLASTGAAYPPLKEGRE